MRESGRRGIIFWLSIIAVAYGLLSVSIAIATANDCGELDARKEWKIFPPEWECQGF